jgi:hypothetical protein
VPPVSRKIRISIAALLGALMALTGIGMSRVGAQDWRTASREPVGLAPDPAAHREPIVQVYAARTWGWRGNFGVHTWIATKRANARAYTVYEVIGWKLRWGGSALSISERAPDARWYGNAPELIAERRGPGVEAFIERIDAAARSYPYARSYSVWPGPNSNTFAAWVTRAVPELGVDLPPTAIGKDYTESLLGTAPSGQGVQLSLRGLFALTASEVEGVEVSLLGLTFGVNPFRPAIKLPFVGRIGMPRSVGSAAAAQPQARPVP